MSDLSTLERAVFDEWHVLGALADFQIGRPRCVRLLGVPIEVTRGVDLSIGIKCQGPAAPSRALPAQLRYGHVWTTLGDPGHDLFEIPEYEEPDRRVIHAGTFGLRTSAPRVVENFLDLAHFPFVHTGYLGVEPHTRVEGYEVTISKDEREIRATRCRFQQPRALNTTDCDEVELVYRVPHPYCAMLYRHSSVDASRYDLIVAFIRPDEEERIWVSLSRGELDHGTEVTASRRYLQLIFGQDRPIVENQRPRRLPLDPRAEVTVRSDRSSAMYRRWLSRRGIRYGTIPEVQRA